MFRGEPAIWNRVKAVRDTMKKRFGKALGNQRGDLMVEGIVSSSISTIVVLGVAALFFVMNNASASTAEHTHQFNELRNVAQKVATDQSAPAIGAAHKTTTIDGVPYTVWSEPVKGADGAVVPVADGIALQEVRVAAPRNAGDACTPASLDGCLVTQVNTLVTDGGFALKRLGDSVDSTDINSFKVQLGMDGSGAGTPREARYLFNLDPSPVERTVSITASRTGMPADEPRLIAIDANASGFFYGSVLMEPLTGSAIDKVDLTFTITGGTNPVYKEITVYEGPVAP